MLQICVSLVTLVVSLFPFTMVIWTKWPKDSEIWVHHACAQRLLRRDGSHFIVLVSQYTARFNGCCRFCTKSISIGETLDKISPRSAYSFHSLQSLSNGWTAYVHYPECVWLPDGAARDDADSAPDDTDDNNNGRRDRYASDPASSGSFPYSSASQPPIPSSSSTQPTPSTTYAGWGNPPSTQNTASSSASGNNRGTWGCPWQNTVPSTQPSVSAKSAPPAWTQVPKAVPHPAPQWGGISAKQPSPNAVPPNHFSGWADSVPSAVPQAAGGSSVHGRTAPQVVRGSRVPPGGCTKCGVIDKQLDCFCAPPVPKRPPVAAARASTQTTPTPSPVLVSRCTQTPPVTDTIIPLPDLPDLFQDCDSDQNGAGSNQDGGSSSDADQDGDSGTQRCSDADGSNDGA